MSRRSDSELLLGEWACLGIICEKPAHGFAVAARLKPEADVGRVWTLSRALTYRAIAQLEERKLIEAVHEEPGVAGGNRVVYRATRKGRNQYEHWLNTPVDHIRDLRSALLVKLVLAHSAQIDVSAMLKHQTQLVSEHLAELPMRDDSEDDPVELWRNEMAAAALRFLKQL